MVELIRNKECVDNMNNNKTNDKSIYVTKPSLPPFEEFVEELQGLWETGILTHTGPRHRELQRKLEEYLSVPNVSLFSNGHQALELGMKAMHLEGEVITTPFTFGSTTQAILRNGLKPVFCDIRKDDFTIDCDKIEELITDKTCAILPVHVYGNICDVEAIDKIAKKYNLKVIYDGAHAFGEKYKGVNVSNFGDMTMYSFHATKVFNTFEGGCVTFDASKFDYDIVEYLNGLKQFGQIVGTESTPFVGTNAKLTEVAAIMGICNLRHFSEYINKRKKVVAQYRKRLADLPGIQLSIVQSDVESNASYFPLVLNEQEAGLNIERLIEALKNENIYVRRYFYPLTSDFEVIKSMGIEASVENAKYVSDRVVTLPCYSDLEIDDVNRICDVIERAVCMAR